ncbi:putative DNA repair protein Rad4 [Aspergillus saccharolyticus JOP 1030-1]|uniref:Putative DNA repair protein Rad4 n=1 Tax=Aspergillus saccharolyticus JOP 1030-1 TaxID=1450539 RepID=A0A318ZQT9_9EURO|nr:putative DNA repair protein Rad4 [Aspergillus saccharolyticus JOP 1030-1]PYH49886.1 putative DNA repair protein Rad4 [Aspergillus saccharolyticus JOP 1030-1]
MAVNTPTRRSTRRNQNGRIPPTAPTGDQQIPQVYREMLAEAEARDPQAPDNDRIPKRRKLAGRNHVSSTQIDHQKTSAPIENNEPTGRQVQTVYDSPTSSSEDDDMEWEDVDLQPAVSEALSDDSTIQITLDQPQESSRHKRISKRQPITAAEKRLRLEVHKTHLLCLLRHVQIRNRWCNDDELQDALKKMIPKQVKSLLNPPESKPEHERSTTFMNGLNQVSDAFSKRFKITKPGLKRANWAQGPDALKKRVETIISNAEVFTSIDDFKQQARTMQGSRDFGAQLFCALLRSVAVEARLVCSLQPLPFSGVTKDITLEATPAKTMIMADSPETSSDESTRAKSRASAQRLTRPGFRPSRPPASPREIPYNRNQESSYPVFWVEAFNEAFNKWIPVDPLVTRSLAKPSKFEPPATDPNNLLSYVVAFEDDASARDVTRRYSKAFNAKTRKLRVESTTRNTTWWDRVLRFYEKPFLEDRDQLEVSELTAKTAAEPMPRNIQDFKDHPVYALERHLRRSEVIHPKRVIGQVSLGKSGSKNQILEPVYRRSDVQVVRSADKWYRLGRDIKTGEQPLKRVKGRRPQSSGLLPEDEGSDAAAPETPLYALFQTQVYVPPPVVNGRVPKNVYGNLDIYVPSMIPAGGIHIGHPDAAHAAKLLGIDFAAAVTGFTFQGRHGTAVYTGVIVAEEHREALQEVIDGLERERLHEALETRTAEVLRAWKHLLLKLRIAERVKGYAIEGDDEDADTGIEPSEVGDEAVDDDGGGFVPESDTAVPDPVVGGGGFIPDSNTETLEDSMGGGGFLPESGTETPDDNVGGGGFMPESPIKDSMGVDHTSSESLDPIPAKPSRYSLVVVSKNRENPTDPSAQDHIIDEASRATKPAATEEPDLYIRSREPVSSGTSDNHELSIGEGNISAPESVQKPPRSPSTQSSDVQSRRASVTSLLSQDPDDEDAIPEWLMSD